MTFEVVDRRGLKQEMKSLLRGAEVNPKAFAALYLGLSLLLSLADWLASGSAGASFENPLALFVRILTSLVSSVLTFGFLLYCMAVRGGQRAEFLTLFDGFSFAGRVVGLYIMEVFFIMLWSMLFVIPGIIAAYRYRFAYYNLCENPALGALDALNLSKRQTVGYKGQLLTLDLSYLGWLLLASLPSAVFTGMAAASSLPSQAYVFGPAVLETVPALPLWQSLASGVWSLGVALFYLPVYQCTEIGYYETAKRTSGAAPTFPDLPLQGQDQNNPF